MREARSALTFVSKTLKINNKDVNDRVKLLTQLIKEKEFFESIAYENEIDKLDPEKLVVPKDYDGPTLTMDSQIDWEWM